MLEFSLSVHDIVDLLLRKGHLDTRIFNQASMLEGSRLHSFYQSKQGPNYMSEYSLSDTFKEGDYLLKVSGIADGIIFNDDGSITVDEIKTTVSDLDSFIEDHYPWHLGQAIFYAYMIANKMNLKEVNVRLTYIKQRDINNIKYINEKYKFENLENYVKDAIHKYIRHLKRIQRLKDERDESVKDLKFPFDTYRIGQKDLMNFVTDACEDKSTVFVEAPTGIGKTISVLYPMVKRFGEKKADHIYYLTSKNSIKKIAMSTLEMFSNSGAKLKSIEFTSKENICFNDRKGHCNPDECPFARYYYDKLLETIYDSLNEYNFFNRRIIEKICLNKSICPFQFQLDLAKYCDVQVCDYTYVFDFHHQPDLIMDGISEKQSLLCVDECHNLPDRIRDMYSIDLERKEIEDTLSLCQGKEFKALKADIKTALVHFDDTPIDLEDENVIKNRLYIRRYPPAQIIDDFNDILDDIKHILKNYPEIVSDELLEFYSKINDFVYLNSLVNSPELGECFLFYIKLSDDDEISSFRIIALDCRPLVLQGTDLFKTTVFFSATLSPKDYYIDILGGNTLDPYNRLILPSPFKSTNCKVLVDQRISLYYKDRMTTLPHVFKLINTAIHSKVGNYFVFCPSFEYLENLKNIIEKSNIKDVDFYYQAHSMKESERDEFLSKFSADNTKTTVGIMALGGVFSEGIDLIGDRLIGCIIISVGIPQINFERDRLKEYYDIHLSGDEEQKGFKYSYTYPGINKVLQAAGRVIRTEDDRGFVLFIDSRFKQSLYRDIIQEVYPQVKPIYSSKELLEILKDFWKGNK